jgi:CheY-like chemotaxis protein
VNVEGLALLWCKDRIVGRYRLKDLSIGGCQLRDGPACELGSEYGLVLDLEPHGAMRLPAKLVRQRAAGRGRHELGLSFLVHPPWTEDRIHDLVMENLERDYSPAVGRVLVVDGDSRRRYAIVEALRSLGCDVLEASTPVEAVWELENGPMDFHTVFVARVLGAGDGRDLVRFIGARYAGVRRVLLGEQDRPEGHDADAVLAGPFEGPRLRRALPHALLTANTSPRPRARAHSA